MMTSPAALFAALGLAAVLLSGCAARPTPHAAQNDTLFSLPVTTEELRAAYISHSGPAIINALHEPDEANWNHVMARVEAGDGEWISAAIAYLLPIMDADDRKELFRRLALALPVTPDKVLYQDFGLGPSLSVICSLPFPDADNAFLADYARRALEALDGVDDPWLQENRGDCMRYIRESLTGRGLSVADRPQRQR